MSNKVRALHAHAPAPAALDTPTDLNEKGIKQITAALNGHAA